MIYLKLFLAFFEIGAVSFGGGYGMIPLIHDKVVLLNSWLSEDEFLNLVAVSEATPGPIAVNMATFVGTRQAGIGGALIATLGAIVPSFILILLIAALIGNILKYRGTRAFLSGIRPCVVALILSTSLIMLLKNLFGFTDIHTPLAPDAGSLLIGVILVVIAVLFQHFRKKSPSPILMLLISACLGVVVCTIENAL